MTAGTGVRAGRVAIPNEHGGWSLTLEPALLGLLVAPGPAGILLTLAGLVAFVSRAPIKLSIGDRLRHRLLPRTRLADRFSAGYLLTLAVLLTGAAATAHRPFWMPLVAALPLLAIAIGFDVRSRGRRLVPELAGAIGIAAIGAAIVLAGDGGAPTALGVWGVATARVVASVPYVRLQLRRAKGQSHRLGASDGAQLAGLATVAATVATGLMPWPALVATGALAAAHFVTARMKPPRAPVLGGQETILGLMVVLVSGLAAAAP